MKLTKCIVTSALVIVAAGCGDPPTSDKRGYTKAPLERVGTTVHGEVGGPMRVFGEPQLPTARVLSLEAAPEGDGGG